MGRYNYDDGAIYCLNVYYSACVIGGAERPGDDAAGLAWFGPDELPGMIAFDHASDVLADWAERKRQGR